MHSIICYIFHNKHVHLQCFYQFSLVFKKKIMLVLTLILVFKQQFIKCNSVKDVNKKHQTN